MRIVEKRGLWFLISIIVMLPGLLFMIWSLATGRPILPLSIDYTGGVTWELRFEQPVSTGDVLELFHQNGFDDVAVTTVGDAQTVQIKTKEMTPEQKSAVEDALEAAFGPHEERSYINIGPAIGGEVSRAALLAVAIASLLILFYLAWSFRQVPHPLRYGASAVIALVHDVLVTFSFIAIMYFVGGWEVDALFLTAILTVIGYSVSDSIVIFDRIRENLKRHRNESFATVANRSIVETASRSLGTQIATLLSMLAIMMLGGATLQKFISIMLVGIISGTYSSIFNAACVLVAWEEGSLLPKKKDAPKAITAGKPAAA